MTATPESTTNKQTAASNHVSKKRQVLGSVCLSSLVPILLCIATSLFSPTTETDCRPYPLPTGEKVLLATPEATPPLQVRPGQQVNVAFSSGYVFYNYVIHCTDDERVAVDENTGLGTAHADILAWAEYTQTTSIRLAQSENECAIELVVPMQESSYAVVCSNGERAGRIQQQDLPRKAYSRTVGVYLDADGPIHLGPTPIAEVECRYQCTIAFVVPPDTAPGLHKLKVLIDPYLLVTYNIEVVASDSKTP